MLDDYDDQIRHLVEVERLGRPAIARRLGIPEHTVRLAMVRLGLRRPPGPPARQRWLSVRLTPSEYAELLAAVGEGELSATLREALLAWARERSGRGGDRG